MAIPRPPKPLGEMTSQEVMQWFSTLPPEYQTKGHFNMVVQSHQQALADKQTQDEIDSQQPSDWAKAAGYLTPIAGPAAWIAGSKLAAAPTVAAPEIIGATMVPGATGATGASAAGAASAAGSGAGAASTGAAGAGAASTGAAGAGAAGAGMGEYIIPGIGIALGSYGLYNQLSNEGSRRGQGMQAGTGAASGAALGAGLGSVVPGVGTAIGAGVGTLLGGAAGFLHGNTASGKGADQQQRDAIRQGLQGAGFVGDDWMYNFSDGSSYDMGRDGDDDKQFQIGYGNTDEGFFNYSDFRPDGMSDEEIDAGVTKYINDNYGTTVEGLNPLMSALLGTGERATDFVGQYTNAIHNSDGDHLQRYDELTDSLLNSTVGSTGMDAHNTLYSKAWQDFEAGKLDEGQRDAQLAALDLQWGIDNPNGPEDERLKAQANPLYGIKRT